MADRGAIGKYSPPPGIAITLNVWQSDPSRSPVLAINNALVSHCRPQVVFPGIGDFLAAATKPNNGSLSGLTQVNGVIEAGCKVRLYHRDSGFLAGESISDEDGFFSFRGLDQSNPEQWYLVALDKHGGVKYNGLASDWMTPYFDSSTIEAREVAVSGFLAEEVPTGARVGDLSWGVAILMRNPSAYYKMDEISGTVLTDSSANGIHGTIGANVLVNQPALRTDGKSMYFNGAGGSICSVPYDSRLSVYEDDTWTVSYIIKKTSGTSGSIWRFIAGVMLSNLGGTARLALTERSGVFSNRLENSTDFNTTATVALDTIYRVFVVRNGSSLKFYLNGVQINDWTISTGFATSANQFNIGGNEQYPASYNFNGYISDVALFNHALTASDIAEIEASTII